MQISVLKNPECDFQLQDFVFAKCKNFNPWPAQVIKIIRGKPTGSKVEEYIYKVEFIGHRSTADLRSVDLEEFSEQTIKKYSKMYHGTHDPEQLRILKCIGQALNKKRKMQTAIPVVKIQFIEKIKSKKQSRLKNKTKSKQKQIKNQVKLEYTVNQGTTLKQKQKQTQKIEIPNLIQPKINAKTKNKKNQLKCEPKSEPTVKIQQHLPIRSNFHLPLTNQIEVKLEEAVQKSIKVQKLKKRPQGQEKSPEKFGLKSILNPFSFQNSKQFPRQKYFPCMLPYVPYIVQKDKQNSNHQIKKQPNGLDIFQDQVSNLLSLKKQPKKQEVKTVKSFDLSLLFKVKIPYNYKNAERLTKDQEQADQNKITIQEQPEQTNFNLQTKKQIPQEQKRQYKQTINRQELRKRYINRPRFRVKQKKIRKRQVKPKWKIHFLEQTQKLSKLLINQLKDEIEFNKYIQTFKLFRNKNQFAEAYGNKREGWTNYATNLIKALIAQLKNKDNNEPKFPDNRKNTLTELFNRQQLKLQTILTKGIFNMMIDFINRYEVAQSAIKKKYSVEYKFYKSRMKVYSIYFYNNLERINLTQSKKQQLIQVLQYQTIKKRK